MLRVINLIGHWDKGREGSQVSGLGNINTIWRYWGRGKLNEENAKFSFEAICMEALVLSGAQG